MKVAVFDLQVWLMSFFFGETDTWASNFCHYRLNGTHFLEETAETVEINHWIDIF